MLKLAGAVVGAVMMITVLIAGTVGGIVAAMAGPPAPLTACGLPSGPSAPAALGYPLAPGTYRLGSPFGARTNPITGTPEQHHGQDFAAPEGTPIYAAADGTVTAAGPATGFGQWIVIDHTLGGHVISTVYGHMWPQGVAVITSQHIHAGQPIGQVGNNGQSTGPHLHFEAWPGGRFTGGTPVDPLPLLTGASHHQPAPDRPPAAAAAAATSNDLMPLPLTTPQRHLDLTTEQLANAALIVTVGQQRGLPPRAWVIAIATALQESSLHNLDHGDRDSIGLFQQRPSTGWGTVGQIMNPTYAATRFYAALQTTVITNDPHWNTRPLTQIAQTVQRSGLPNAYAQWEQLSADTVLAIHGPAPSCTPAL
jgi:peptidoglycan DL-endopeptidase RipA